MDYALEERIGNPDLFTGRKGELVYFLKWINDIKERKSQSTAVLARRKMGKTALMERLFNIIFYKNDGVIPFYYEVKEVKKWVGDFCVDFFLTFIYQYVAFKTRDINYLKPLEKNDFAAIKEITRKEGFDDLTALIKSVEYSFSHGHVDILWDTVREAPMTIAHRKKEFIVQMIDEFQFLNAMIYWDKAKSENQLADTLAGGYLSTAESKIAPLLVSGSWVGWLMNQLIMMLPARFKYKSLKNMPEDEAVEMVFKYSRFFDVPVTEETAYLIAHLSEGSPFYISSIIRSEYEDKDLTTVDGLTRTLEFETLDDHGVIKFTWMEYVKTAFSKVNDKNAKKIVLHLCKHKGREVTRKELIDELHLDIPDEELEKKLDALVKSDIIKQGQTNFDYQCVQDNVFDKVFRGVYQKEIEHFDVGQIKKEYNQSLEELNKQYRSLQGKYNYQQGYFAEYLILDQLKYRALEKNELLKSITRYLPGDFDFCDYSRVWRYDSSPEYARRFSVDIFARSRSPADYSIIGEVKSRDVKKFSKDEVIDFEKKLEEVKKIENIERAIGFIFSRSGFTKEAEAYCQERGIACSEDERWLETGKFPLEI
ncbi:MAG: hypothetical protein GTO45_09495 [Candidatus Aminicenantes bacterium]|nr:hypothetical protein [Candidatus Aminicenantes bacterium]NIM79048.1 hypothetical protein [Candidatus Aminicenantes bacterium]NIN18327.1 hypothetical protein [Candidatus Aminicenantes bacterium]NIN42214.1 hypothetical protein [Candidatus Aminicenantes bacterium]NIN84980.1 hypothetical protein [Candidatus Aminicenantes bacterium]